MRIYDPRIGKFLSVDPLTKDFPWYTPYQFAGNKPIIAIDLEGKEKFVKTYWYNAQSKLYSVQLKYDPKAEPLQGSAIHAVHNYPSIGFIRTSMEDLPGLDFLNKEYGYPNVSGVSDFTVRSKNVRAFFPTYSKPWESLMSEFGNGIGPENSVIFGADHPMIKDIKDMAGYKAITEAAYKNGWQTAS